MALTLAQFGPNPHADRDPNADHGWGGFQWPKGVPDDKLGVARTPRFTVTVRLDLVDLVEAAFALIDALGYTVFDHNPDGSGENWGPWSYQNRDIRNDDGTGTGIPSNHSRAKAVDLNAPLNPRKAQFVTNIPPVVVSAMEQIGFFWGGRYTAPTKFDPMHFEYCFTPNDVPGHLALAQRYLSDIQGGQIPESLTALSLEEDDMTDNDRELLRQIREIAALAAERALDATKHAIESRDSGNNAASIGSDVRNLITSIVIPGLGSDEQSVDPNLLADQLAHHLAITFGSVAARTALVQATDKLVA